MSSDEILWKSHEGTSKTFHGPNSAVSVSRTSLNDKCHNSSSKRMVDSAIFSVGRALNNRHERVKNERPKRNRVG